ncbi:MAG TPA: hypothetical protein VMG12_44000 [Polyangiaceae bacterium]|nr:hypothetical protein [Polyangiaceae bacterium]
MGSKPARSAIFAGGLLAAVVLQAGTPLAALAQHADAGVEKAAEPAHAEPPTPPVEAAAAPAAEAPHPNGPSGVLPKMINPGLLSESTRARLAERAGGRHASALPLPEPQSHRELPPEVQGTAGTPSHRLRAGSEPLRRGQARLRVQAVETDEGVTLLSNRIQLPETRLSAAVAKTPLPEPPEPRVLEEPVALADTSNVTETHSLRPMSSRAAKANSASSGLGWLLWPFALFVTTGAVVGTLWFRKKTE